MTDEAKIQLHSTALQVNLERTQAEVQIPPKYAPFLTLAAAHFGLSRRITDLLTELNHPLVNWGYVLNELRSISLGNFYEISGHPLGVEVLSMISDIYIDVTRLAADGELRERAVRYLFDFLNALLDQSHHYLERNIAVVSKIVGDAADESEAFPQTWKKGSGYVKRLLRFVEAKKPDLATPALQRLLFNIFRATYLFWLSADDPFQWRQTVKDSAEEQAAFDEIVFPLGHRHIGDLLAELDAFHAGMPQPVQKVRFILDLPDYSQIVNAYLVVADALERAPAFEGRQHLLKLDFLFSMMGAPGLAEIHSATLREINRCLRMVFSEKEKENLDAFVRQIFALLSLNCRKPEHGGAILDCIGTIAKEVFALNDHPLVDRLIDEIVAFGFQRPDITGTTTDWQVQVNPLHIRNIRLWLAIIAMKPRWTKRLLSALIANLKIGGVFVRDTDLLQKDISALLNADIAPAYNLVKQLVRIFPIYFKEIGAEGELREASTKVDELTFRRDRLVNFLRKQSHVESNSLLVPFMEAIFRFWSQEDKTCLKPYLPPEVFEQIPAEGELFDGMHAIFGNIFTRVSKDPKDLLSWDKPHLQKVIRNIRGVPDIEKERACLMVRLYQLLYKKYNPQHVDLIRDMEASGTLSIPKIRALKRSLSRRDYARSIGLTLELLALLKGRILDPKQTEGFENIYFKRHIAQGIPSMYGTYTEEKFDALGLSLRLESLATVLFQELATSINAKFITKSTLMGIHRYLWLYVKALELDGISTEGLEAKMKYLTSALQLRQFSVDQYIDIFTFISKGIQDIIRDYYIDAHSATIPIVVSQTFRGNALTATDGTPSAEETLYQEAENFFRGLIASAFGIQVFDNFVNGIIKTLGEELEKFKENKNILNLVMNYNPDLAVSSINEQNEKTDNQILIGNKGYFLKKLAALSFPVPPGFIISTEVFRGYDAVVGYKYIFKDLASRINRELIKLERASGLKYGDPSNPLLLSVRSGATMSLPGMMQSFLNVGINEDIAEGLSRKDGFSWAAWDSYRRFLQTWGMFQGLDRDFFDNIINEFKSRRGVMRKMDFAVPEMRDIALSYKTAMNEKGVHVPDDPYKQLQEAILQVFASWDSQQAKTYRRQMHLSDEWGTAVIVQEMVYGNLNDTSGSGVIFTRNPKATKPGVSLYGDFIFGVQGDDIVSGLVVTYPISEQQRVVENRESNISLESRFPEVYLELQRLSEILIYEKGFNHQELEFTFEKPVKEGLYILQTREMVQSERKKRSIFRETSDLQRSFLGTGIGVSGGALCGRVVYSEADIISFRMKEPDTPLILIRPDTVPDDVGILLKVDGLLTARGGGTSHAAVTIPQLHKVGVVGFNKLKVYEADGYSTVGDFFIRKGDYIAIDGWSGAAYSGRHEYLTEEAFTISL